MKIDANRKIVVEDFQQAERTLIQKLAQVVNPFMEQVAQALSGNIQKDNLKQQDWTFELLSGTSTMTVAWSLNEKPRLVQVGRLITKSSSDSITQPFSLTWTYADGKIDLTFIGLAAQDHVATVVGQA